MSLLCFISMSFLTLAGFSNGFRGLRIPIERDLARVDGEEINMEHMANRIGITLRGLIINHMHLDTEVWGKVTTSLEICFL